jgi:hypothetical protein
MKGKNGWSESRPEHDLISAIKVNLPELKFVSREAPFENAMSKPPILAGLRSAALKRESL